MTKVVCCIPADKNGNTLFIKDYSVRDKRHFVKYKSTYNDITFIETEVFLVDGGNNFAITSDNGTVLFRFSVEWINKML